MATIALSANTAWSLYNYRQELIDALVAAEHRIFVLAPEDKASSKLAAMGCEVLDIEIDNKGTHPLKDCATLVSYVGSYRKIRPDIALHYTIKPIIYGTLAARLVGVPCINTLTGLGAVFTNRSPVTRLVEWLYRTSQRSAIKVFFLNHDDMALFVARRLIGTEKAEVLPGEGINLHHFSAMPPANTTRVVVFLLMARMLWDKGIGEYVSAARVMKASHPRVRFQLLGPCDVPNPSAVSRQTMESWVKEGIVEYLGEAEDVRPYISAADCVVLPSYREGMPRSLLEASAMGRPVIAADSAGCREVVEDGVTGYLCRAKDAADLAEKMERILSLSLDARAAMGRKGREKMEREFDNRYVIDRYLAVLQDTLAGIS